MTHTNLIQNGWQFVDVFAGLEIWKHNTDRILYNPQTQTIHMEYKVEAQYEQAKPKEDSKGTSED